MPVSHTMSNAREPGSTPACDALDRLRNELARRKAEQDRIAPRRDECAEWVRAYDRDIREFDAAMKRMWEYGCDWRIGPNPPSTFDPKPWIPDLLVIGRLIRDRNWHDLLAKGIGSDSPEWEALTYQLLRVAAEEGCTETTLAEALVALADAEKLSLIGWQHPFNYLNVAIRQRLAPDRDRAFPDLFGNDKDQSGNNESADNSPPPSDLDLVELRNRCYPSVPIAELRPLRPEPPTQGIAAAMADVPRALTESQFGGPNLHLPADPSEHSLAHAAWLAFAEERGHGRAAAEWAIYRLVETDGLYVVWPSIEQPLAGENVFERSNRLSNRFREQTLRYRGGKPATVTNWDLFECGRVLHLHSTPLLWEWFGKGCPDDAALYEDALSESNDPSVVESATVAQSPTLGIGDANQAKVTHSKPFVFARSGDGYFVRAFGAEGHFSNLAGFRVLDKLLRSPGKLIPMLDLDEETAGLLMLDENHSRDMGLQKESRTRQEAIDPTGIGQIRDKIRQLTEEVKDADNEFEKADSQSKLDKVTSYLKTAMGHSGMSRNLNDPAGRIRSKIAGRIKTALNKFREAEPSLAALADHFESPTIRAEGMHMVYDPSARDPATDWDFSPVRR